MVTVERSILAETTKMWVLSKELFILVNPVESRPEEIWIANNFGPLESAYFVHYKAKFELENSEKGKTAREMQKSKQNVIAVSMMLDAARKKNKNHKSD